MMCCVIFISKTDFFISAWRDIYRYTFLLPTFHVYPSIICLSKLTRNIIFNICGELVREINLHKGEFAIN